MLTFAAFSVAVFALLICFWWSCLNESDYIKARLMLDQEDLKWIAATSTELNSILQQVSRYADLARRHRGEHNYIDLLGERVQLASKTAQSLFDRVTSKILAGAARKTAAARKSEAGFKVMPPPAETEPSRS